MEKEVNVLPSSCCGSAFTMSPTIIVHERGASWHQRYNAINAHANLKHVKRKRSWTAHDKRVTKDILPQQEIRGLRTIEQNWQ